MFCGFLGRIASELFRRLLVICRRRGGLVCGVCEMAQVAFWIMRL